MRRQKISPALQRIFASDEATEKLVNVITGPSRQGTVQVGSDTYEIVVETQDADELAECGQ